MASKIADGIFIGDAATSADPEFLELNKISNLVNLSGREVPNVFSAHGLVYLTFLWEDRPDFRLFGDVDNSSPIGEREAPPPLQEIIEFIDGSLKHGISVLLFSARGSSRCVVACCAYLMSKYRWGFEKAFALVASKKPDAQPNRGFIQQMISLDKTLLLQRNGLRPNNSDAKHQHQQDGPFDGYQLTLNTKDMQRWRDWDPSYLSSKPSSSSTSSRANSSDPDDSDELLLINSFLNSRQAPSSSSHQPKGSSHRRRVVFPAGRAIALVQDPYSAPSVPPTGPVRVAGILKGSSSSAASSVSAQADSKRPISAGPRRRTGGAGAGGSDGDLYGFVGMESSGGSGGGGGLSVQGLGSSMHQSNGSSSSRMRPSSASTDRSLERVENLTAEQRVQQMMAAMRRPSAGEEKGGPFDRVGSERDRDRDVVRDRAERKVERSDREREREREKERGDKDVYRERDSRSGGREADRESKLSSQAQGPSLYDLAYNMPLRPATGSAALSGGADEEDPLAAFGLLQGRGAVRARHDVLEVKGKSASGPSGGLGLRPGSAGANAGGGSGSGGGPAASPGKIYRRGSPLPSRNKAPMMRPSSPASAMENSSIGSLQRRGSNGSIGSISSIGSDNRNSGASRDRISSTPTRAARAGTPTRGWR